MNKDIKKAVYNIMMNDELARVDDWYLVLKVVTKLVPCNSGTAFIRVLEGMKYKGISFEAITRRKRDFFITYPHLRDKEAEKIRRREEKFYVAEYGGNKNRR